MTISEILKEQIDFLHNDNKRLAEHEDNGAAMEQYRMNAEVIAKLAAAAAKVHPY